MVKISTSSMTGYDHQELENPKESLVQPLSFMAHADSIFLKIAEPVIDASFQPK